MLILIEDTVGHYCPSPFKRCKGSLNRERQIMFEELPETTASESVVRPPVPSLLQAATSDSLLTSLSKRLLWVDNGLGLFRLVHLLDAIARSPVPSPRSIISVGSGLGLHEAFLARLFPNTSVLGVDLRANCADVALPNLSFHQEDILNPDFSATLPRADFVYTIECLEHIEEDERVVELMASLVCPNGALYIEVPFATDEEISNPATIKEQFELHEHVRPGYTGDGLIELCHRWGLSVEHLAGTFWFPIQPLVYFGIERFGAEPLFPYWYEFLELALRDVRDGVPASRLQATAIKVLAVNRRAA